MARNVILQVGCGEFCTATSDTPVLTIPLTRSDAKAFTEAANGGVIRNDNWQQAAQFTTRTTPRLANDFHVPVRVHSASRLSALSIRMHEFERKEDPFRTALSLECPNQDGSNGNCPYINQMKAFINEARERNLIQTEEGTR